MTPTSTKQDRFDRPCEHLARKSSETHPWDSDHARNAVNLAKDGAQHRRYHSFYEDLLN